MNFKLIGLTLAVLASTSCMDRKDGIDEQCKSAVLATLSDPNSAQFRNLEMRGPCLVGEVNAKNKFGGYVGFRKFAAVHHAAVIDMEDATPSRKFIFENCFPVKNPN